MWRPLHEHHETASRAGSPSLAPALGCMSVQTNIDWVRRESSSMRRSPPRMCFFVLAPYAHQMSPSVHAKPLLAMTSSGLAPGAKAKACQYTELPLRVGVFGNTAW